ncbi:hypothetical protein PUNSTDRAFT_50759 [Punctularia strigosozonata HHB-11173 SS5]|uniref:uncharacterized protein n=1 Tax=Punctularia strigosozonata (strain HHB-11173) TaxID=741275 RepID=UPI0004417DA3|nr:uncharacterized protein PUNSTDRAFT_50759 [Punctularia strigosozonata HHB-11173 SS5]EIN11948.1 hypothetical protein PUNSTDRAFT_50759 [Punctularia strigosozonata HHB-11173 SS5]
MASVSSTASPHHPRSTLATGYSPIPELIAAFGRSRIPRYQLVKKRQLEVKKNTSEVGGWQYSCRMEVVVEACKEESIWESGVRGGA